jgi:hypothetical protein
MFVTASDFNIPPTDIPSLDKVPTLFQSFVDQEEDKYLREVLGDSLYEAFIDGLGGLPNELDLTVATIINTEYVYGNDVWKALTVTTGVIPIEGTDWTLLEEGNRWLLLNNGNTYLYNGKTNRWKGMKAAVKSLIYAQWVEYGCAKLTINGFVIPAMENNVSVDPSPYICRQWNEWAKQIGGVCRQHNSLYGYLQAVELSAPGTFDDTFDDTFTGFVDYLNYEFNEQQTRNTFGI